MTPEQKQYLARENERHWKKYLKAVEKAKEAFETEPFDYNAVAVRLAEAKNEIRRCADTKVIKGQIWGAQR